MCDGLAANKWTRSKAVVSEEEGVGLGIACHPPTTSSQQLSAPVCVQLGGGEEGQVKLMNTNGPVI